MTNIASIIVTYHPDLAALVRICATLLQSGSRVVVVDNSEKPEFGEADLPHGAKVITLCENTGIAHAQNVGIDAARAQSADLIFFFDQDSAIDASYVPAMVRGVDPRLPSVHGPVCIDAVRGFEYPTYRVTRHGLPQAVLAADQQSSYPVDLIISSGSLVSAITFDVAGMMDEDFFIDYVDLEWCLRCRARGVPISVNRNVTMTHSVGTRSVKLGPITTFIHSPLRTYYKMRNPFLLFRKKEVGRMYAAKEVISALLHHAIQLAFLDERRAYAGPIAAGLRDGLQGRSGKRSS